MKKALITFGVIITFIISFIIYIYTSLDGLRGFILSFGINDETIYATGYSDSKFKKIEIGMTKNDVINILGYPLRKIWNYGKSEYILFNKENLVFVFVNQKKTKRVKKGMSEKEVVEIVGPPNEERWGYSSSPIKKDLRVRAVYFKKDKVSKIRHIYHSY